MATDRPIIFSAPMVRALLAGRKTQTRRIIGRRVATIDVADPADVWSANEKGWTIGPIYDGRSGSVAEPCAADCFERVNPTWQRVQPGDRLWVRESFAEAFLPRGAAYMADHSGDPRGLGWRPSIHMPRWASRITLTVAGVRRQRLQDIRSDDCLAEGIPPITDEARWSKPIPKEPNLPAIYRGAFCQLWNDIHGAGAWDANPEVVALTFTVAQRNIDAPAAGARVA